MRNLAFIGLQATWGLTRWAYLSSIYQLKHIFRKVFAEIIWTVWILNQIIQYNNNMS